MQSWGNSLRIVQKFFWDLFVIPEGKSGGYMPETCNKTGSNILGGGGGGTENIAAKYP